MPIAVTFMHTFTINSIDYCNCFFTCSSNMSIDKHQPVLYIAAYVLTEMKIKYWTSRERIMFKLGLKVLKCLEGPTMLYRSTLAAPCCSRSATRHTG